MTIVRKKPMNRGTSQLKRSEFKRSEKQTLHRSALKGGTKKLRAYRYRKASSGDVFRSEAYLAVVRTLDCARCGIEKRTEPAHSNQLRFGKGKGIKSSDATVMALCKTVPGREGCHARHDQGGKLEKAEWWAFEYKHICLTVIALLEGGKLSGQVSAAMLINVSVSQDGMVDWESAALYFISLIESGELKVVSGSGE